MIKLFLAFLTLWCAGALILAGVALSDLLFTGSGFKVHARRLIIAIIWPVSLLSSAGRSRILSLFKKTQENR